ncbi:MAG: membrane protein insertase YidC [Bacteroidetes bacterium]|nr:membrane protein insertase YidC [Bacteroidota bacterium]
MDRNTILGLLLIFLLFIGYSWWSSPSKEELAAKQRAKDSLELVQKRNDTTLRVNQTQSAVQDSIKNAEDSLKSTPEKLQNELGSFANAAKGEDKDYIIENDLVKLTVSAKGGRIAQVELKKFQTFDSLPLILFTKDSSEFNLSFFSNNRSINTKQLFFQAIDNKGNPIDKNHLTVSGEDSLSFSMRLFAGDSGAVNTKYIEFVYTLHGNNYMLGFKMNTVGMQDIIASNANFIDLNWNAELRGQEKNQKNEHIITSIYYKPVKDDVDYLKETKDDEASLKFPVKWVSFKQQFFSATLIAQDQFTNADIKSFTDKNKTGGRYLKSMHSLIGIPYQSNTNNSVAMQFYFGPNKYNILKKYNLDLERQIPLGWSFFLLQWINRYAVIPVFDFLSHFNWNYGIIILVLTILLKIVLFPIAYKSYMSSAKMKVLKPEIDEIGLKFPKKEQAMDKQRATMSLYKKAGVNPMAGCIPMLLQFPILIAMFRFFPASIELRQQSFLWANDLSSYDSVFSWTTQIPLLSSFYGNHISLFALLMAISNLIYTKMNQDMMGSTNSMPGMKTMMYIMPIMFLGFLNSYSSALNYYYFLSTMLTFGQMYAIRMFVDEDKIHARIQENKKKPVAKSKFQQRLEDMAKQRGYNAKKSK